MADTWTMLSGYTPSDYVDTMVFEVVSATKKIRPLSGQTLVAGEKNSQYVRFEMDRFWDGIDISAKNFSITYSLAGKYYGTSEAVSAEVSTDRLRFGWIVPEEACCIAGTLMFVLVIKSDGYVLKTQIAETPVVKSLDEESVVPEPTREAWYKEFQARVQADLDASQAALTSAQDALTRANIANDAASSALTAASEANLAAQDAITVAKERYGSPLVANAGPEMVDTNRVYVFTGSESAYTYGHWYYYDNGVWNDGGVYNGNGVNTDKTLSIENMPADAKKTGDEISELKSGFNELDARVNRSARVLNSDSEADFDIADSDGNVILRLANGEIETDKFKSAETLTMSDLADLPEVKDSETQDPNFDIADAYGNVIARVENGEFETKNFRGFQYRTYKSEPQIYSGTLPFTLTVNHHFKKGDCIALHVDLDTTPWNPGRYVNYYVGNKKILNEGRGDNAWLEYCVTEDVDSVSAVYTGAVSATGMNSGLTFTLEVSLLGDIPITPTVITVKQDGSGDFTTLRGALDSIGFKANDVLNPYRVEIYPGTYDVLADYTDEEIEDAQYNLYHFVGPVLYNGVSLVGMGNNPEETVLTASLDPERWSDTIRGVVSTLNCQGSCGFENMTIKAYHLRYCVHDDYTQPFIHRNKRIVKNVIFRGYDVAYTPCTTYGAGSRYSTGVYIFENCDFGDNAGLHTSDSLLEPVKVHLINCIGHGFRIGDNVQGSEPGNESEYRFDNCDFLWINQNMVGTVPHVVVYGSGGRSPLYQFDAQTLYATGDVVIVPNIDKPSEYSGVGTVLEWFASNEHGPRFRPASSYDTARGIVVWEDSEDTYIQTKGYVRTDRTGITTFALGDYVGVVNGVAAIVSDANTAIGRIDYIDNTGAGYIKLNWR